jgi:hypothetical protein
VDTAEGIAARSGRNELVDLVERFGVERVAWTHRAEVLRALEAYASTNPRVLV